MSKPASITVGDLVAARFRIEREAGEGGMGTVYRALDTESGNPVALKFVRADSGADPARFAREITTLAELSHPAIVRYITSGALATGERFLAMEWLEGEDLATRLARQGLSVDESLELVRLVADALSVAHERGIVHRDIKPANMFLPGGEIGRVKLLDFGIARRTRDPHAVTRTGVLIGTPEYMAPEQARGSRELDARADVFALGCVLFECIAGRPAFTGEHLMAVLARILLEEAPKLSEVRQDLPDALVQLVDRMLAKEPEQRPADARVLARELAAIGTVDAPPAHAAHERAPALTASEQRIVCVILAAAIAPPGDALGATLAHDANDPDDAGLRAALSPFDARVESLADGSTIAIVSGEGASTDRATRAARCALLLRQSRPGVPIVLVTGRVLVVARMPMGEVIDRAVRLLPSATPGGDVRVDEVTAGLIVSRFDVATDASGFALRGERPDLDHMRTVLGRRTHCVGRDREIAQLEALLDECISEPVARAVLVTAPPGAGKSRLLHEFLGRIASERGIEVLTGRCESFDAGSPFASLGRAVRKSAGILQGDPIESQRTKLRARVLRNVAAPDVARVSEFLGEIVSVAFPVESSPALRAAHDDAMVMGDAMRLAWEDFLAAETTTRPVLLVLEDLHWSDVPSVKYIDGALRHLRDKPFMVLALARPDVREQFPKLWAERELDEIKLGALTRKASEKLVRDVLGEGTSDKVVARIVERAEGNPFYLEELIRAFGEHADADALPDTVAGMVQARLDLLGEGARRLLRAASVFGGTFTRGGVTRLLGGDAGSMVVADSLDDLAAREIIVLAGRARVLEENVYRFRHALVRDAAYAMLTPHDRALGHRLAAEWLESVGEVNPAILAGHYDRGGSAARAIAWYVRAAEASLDASDIAASLANAERGIALGAEGPELGRCLAVKGEAHFWRGEHVENLRCTESAFATFARGSVAWFAAATGVMLSSAQLGDYEAVQATLEQAIATPALAGVESDKIMAISRGATVLTASSRAPLLAEFSRAIQIEFDRVAALLSPAAVAVHQAWALMVTTHSDLTEYIADNEKLVQLTEAAGQVRSAASGRNNLAFLYAHFGCPERAEPMLRSSIETAERMGAHHIRELARHNLGNVLMLLGRLTEARETELAAIDALHTAGNTSLEGAARVYLSRILILEGDPLRAEQEARLALALVGRVPAMRAVALSQLARSLLVRGRADEALAPAREAITQMESVTHWRRYSPVHATVLAEALDATDDRAGAVALITSLRQRLLDIERGIASEFWRERFLTRVPDNARVIELARSWGIAP